MISDFICLDELSKTQYSLKCSCSLPNPDLYGSEEMIECGTVYLEEKTAENITELFVNLSSNFKDLCIGETYSRKHFVNTLISILQIKYDYDFSNINLILRDCIGEYHGNFYNMEDEIYTE